jgi:hypothetical protein
MNDNGAEKPIRLADLVNALAPLAGTLQGLVELELDRLTPTDREKLTFLIEQRTDDYKRCHLLE